MLYSVLRDTYIEVREKGHNSNSEVIDLVMERHPKLVESYKESLFRRSLGQMLRSIRKSEARALQSPQFVLPLEIAHLRLPADISLPTKEDEEDNWVQLEEATITELDVHMAALTKQIDADKQRFKQLRELSQYLRAHMTEEQRDWAIGLILRDLAAQDRKTG